MEFNIEKLSNKFFFSSHPFSSEISLILKYVEESIVLINYYFNLKNQLNNQYLAIENEIEPLKLIIEENFNKNYNISQFKIFEVQKLRKKQNEILLFRSDAIFQYLSCWNRINRSVKMIISKTNNQDGENKFYSIKKATLNPNLKNDNIQLLSLLKFLTTYKDARDKLEHSIEDYEEKPTGIMRYGDYLKIEYKNKTIELILTKEELELNFESINKFFEYLESFIDPFLNERGRDMVEDHYKYLG
jgi:hypothetical protein